MPAIGSEFRSYARSSAKKGQDESVKGMISLNGSPVLNSSVIRQGEEFINGGEIMSAQDGDESLQHHRQVETFENSPKRRRPAVTDIKTGSRRN